MRNIVLPIGAGVLCVAVFAGMIMSFTEKDKTFPAATNASFTASWPERYPRLTSDGTKLFVNGKEALSVKTPEMDRLGIKLYGVRPAENGVAITLSVNGRKVSQTGASIESPIWCESNQSLFFIQTDTDSSRIWRWDIEKGFRAISQAHANLDHLTISPNGKVLAARINDGVPEADRYSEAFLLVSPEHHREKEINYEDTCSNIVPITENEVLVDGHNTYGDQTYRWNLRRKNVEPIVKDASIVSVANVGGRVFGIHKRDKKFEIVEMNKKFDGWSGGFDLPTGGKPKLSSAN